MNTGLLLGAGASFEIGMPLVSGLTAEFTGYLTPEKLMSLNAGWRLRGGGYTDTVLHKLSAMVTAPGKTYEEILADVEANKSRIDRNDPMHGLHLLLEQIVYGILWSRHVRNAQRIAMYLRFLDGIAALAASNKPLWIFSLNHDLIIESIAIAAGLRLSVGMREPYSVPMRNRASAIIGELPMEFIAGDRLANNGLCFLAEGELGINLLKLHGALDLFTFRDGQDVARILPLQNTIDGLMESLRAIHEDVFFPAPTESGRFNAMNEVAYADKTGEMQFLRRTLLAGALKYDPRRSQVLPPCFLDEFQRNIELLDRIASIGFSFSRSDAHVTRIVSSWLNRDKNRRLEIVSPVRTLLPPELSTFEDQITRADVTATAYLAQYSTQRLTPVEKGLKLFLDRRRGAG